MCVLQRAEGNRPLPNWNPSELNFQVKCSLVNWIFAQSEALEWNSFPILRLWSLKFLKMLDSGAKVGSWKLKNAEMGVLWMARRAWKGVFRAAHTHTPFFSECAPPLPELIIIPVHCTSALIRPWWRDK